MTTYNLEPKFASVLRDIEDELSYQDVNYLGNNEKPLEVWLLLAVHHLNYALEVYAHGTQQETRRQVLKAVACGFRALLTGK